MKLNKYMLWAGVVAVIAVAVAAVIIISGKKPTGLTDADKRAFYCLAASNQLKGYEQVYRNEGTLGCDESVAVNNIPYGPECIFTSTFIYKLDGNYRDNGKQIFSHMKDKGFDFEDGSKYKTAVEKKLNDTSLAANLSDSEPIIVDLYNKNAGTRVRVSLGDRGRTIPFVDGQGVDQLSNEQLIVGLQFYKP